MTGLATYPSEICHDCGVLYGRPRSSVATFYEGACGWCGKATIVTAPRDYCYPPKPKKEPRQ